jgi:CHAD domain-containing protein
MLEPAQTCPTWGDWLSAISEQIDLAKSVGNSKAQPEDEDIHRLRAAVKYARALLRLAPPSVHTETSKHQLQLQRIARRLSRLRERFVLGETLAGLSSEDGVGVKAPLSDKALTALENAKLRLETIGQFIRSLPPPDEDADYLRQRIRHFKRRMRRREPKDWRKATITALHVYRSALIVHLCQVQFLKNRTDKPKQKYIHHLEALRQHLGEINDLDRLIDFSKQRRYSELFEQDRSVVKKAALRQKKLRAVLRSLH